MKPMVEYFRSGNISVGRLDDYNFYVYERSAAGRSLLGKKTGYDGDLAHACLDAAHRLAGQAAKDLEDYARRLQKAGSDILEALQNRK